MGFDDIQSAAFQNPRLTTIRQPLRKMGMVAAESLLRRIARPDDDSYPREIVVEPELIVREIHRATGALRGAMTGVRIDKWLWAARFFKTRALAARACELGRIQAHGQPVKPAREVRIGDMLRVTNDGGDFHVEVLLLAEARGPASIAQTLYRETEESREMRLKVAAESRAARQFEQLPVSRPSKRDRHRIIQFRQKG